MRHTEIALFVLVGLAASFATACNGGESALSGEILPHVSPVVFQDFYPAPDDAADADVADSERTPFEWVLLLQSTGDGPVNIDTVCLEGPAADQFIVEGPKPETVDPGQEAAVRLTYQRKSPGGPDSVAIVVQSDASNYPTLVVPVCARVIDDGGKREAPDCSAPVEAPAEGAKDDSLCGG